MSVMSRKSKRKVSCVISILMALSLAIPVLQINTLPAYAAESGITVKVDSTSKYVPTQIVNGDFDQIPAQGFTYNGKTYKKSDVPVAGLSSVNGGVASSVVYNGVGEGWNTTTKKLFPYGKFYDWSKNVNGSYAYASVQATYDNYIGTGSNWSFIEMNGFEPSVFYQDLATSEGDVIRWTLNHGFRHSGKSDAQEIHVEIGAPKRDSGGKILPATGVGTETKDAKIEAGSLAIFKYNKVVDSTGNKSTRGFGNTTGLKNLRLVTTDYGWKAADAVYIIPEGQTVTRFAFIADSPTTVADGNLLDSITFGTLIGNLSASALKGEVKIKGYWGDSDPSKRLVIEADGLKEYIDMSSVLHNNFEITIPKTIVGGNTEFTIYHEDYPSAKRTVTFLHKHEFEYTVVGHTILRAECVGTTHTEECGYLKADGNYVQMEITGPENTDYTGRPVTAALEGNELFEAVTLKKVDFHYYTDARFNTKTSVYYSGAVAKGAAPTNVGRYYVRATDGIHTIWVSYDISKSALWQQGQTFSVEKLNNKVDEEGSLIKNVSGDSSAIGDINSNLRVLSAIKDENIKVYKLADIEWIPSVGMYSDPIWDEKVQTWVDAKYNDLEKDPERTYASPTNLSEASHAVWDEFYKAMVDDAGFDKSGLLINGPDGTNISTEATLADQQNAEILGQNTQHKPDAENTYYKTEFNNLTFGTYLIAAEGAYNPVVVNIAPKRNGTGYSVKKMFVVGLKSDGMGLTKTINGKNTCTVGTGDVVDFDIQFQRVVAKTTMKLVDTMSPAFTIPSELESDIHIYSDLGKTVEVPADVYSVSITRPTEGSADQTTKMEITFNPSKVAGLTGTHLILSYKAEVTDQVKYNSDDNTNKVDLTVDGDSYETEVKAYTYGLNILKLNGSSSENKDEMTPLAGAEFDLFKEAHIFVNDQYMGTASGNGESKYITLAEEPVLSDYTSDTTMANYYILEEEMEEDGTYEGTTIPYEQGDVISRVFIKVKNAGGYSKKGNIVSTGNADRSGVTISGLDSGCYILRETKAPIGFNELAEDIYFEINEMSVTEAELNNSGALNMFYEMDGNLNEGGRIELVVLNYRGLTLPSTGGIGVLLFIVIGLGLMTSTIVILILRRKKAEEFL